MKIKTIITDLIVPAVSGIIGSILCLWLFGII